MIDIDWRRLRMMLVIPLEEYRTILPFGEVQFGVAKLDHLLSFFLLSPAKSTENGIVSWARPCISSSHRNRRSVGRGAGPTVVPLEQGGPWTFGILANHVWSFAGQSDRAEVSSTFLQPFISYTTPQAWTFALNASDLLKAGQLQSSSEINGIGATANGRNGGGDPYFTDGKAIIGILRTEKRG
ncbi:LssY C-terminal domain-containing protein [Rhizobium leguminosarum]|uniref:LssY C-terminal domain-containing protein n=1 Tax=Rhizobium leguminosarum TaxID=384 RepID=UPI0021BC0977|nr:LssY C-terminal domain-containing protein [Rhizobium leguminosarum]